MLDRPKVSIRIKNKQNQYEEKHITYRNNQISILINNRIKKFQLPTIYPQKTTQKIIFSQNIANLIDSMFKGYSCAFVSLGPHESGKSYTITGSDNEVDQGVLPRISNYLKTKLVKSSKDQIKNILKISCIQIYEQKIIDLLGIRRSRQPRVLEKDGEIDIEAIQYKTIYQIQDLESIIQVIKTKKKAAYSKNIRIHKKCIFIFSFYLQNLTVQNGKQNYKKGCLHIVDWQQSDPYNEEDQNKKQFDITVSALDNVINSLVFGNQKSLIPYHDSVATMILRDFFSGRGKLNVMLHINPQKKYAKQNYKTLKRAGKLTQITNNISIDINISKMMIFNRFQQLKIGKLKRQNCLRQYNEKKTKLKQIKQQIEIQKQEQNKQQIIKDLQRQMNMLQYQIKIYTKIIVDVQKVFLRTKNISKGLSYIEQDQTQIKNKNNLITEIPTTKQELTQASTNLLHSDHEKHKLYQQEIFQVQKQFQSQRQTYLSHIRNIEAQAKFYKKVAQSFLQKQELRLLRSLSKYNNVKNNYQVPVFSIKNKKIVSPLSLKNKSISQRKMNVSVGKQSFKTFLFRKNQKQAQQSKKDQIKINDDPYHLNQRQKLPNYVQIKKRVIKIPKSLSRAKSSTNLTRQINRQRFKFK